MGEQMKLTFKEAYDQFLKMAHDEVSKYNRSIYQMVFAEDNIYNIFRNIPTTDILSDDDRRTYQNNISNYLPKTYENGNNNEYIKGLRNMNFEMSNPGKVNLQECLNALNLTYKMDPQFLSKIRHIDTGTLQSTNEIQNTLEYIVLKIHYFVMFNHIYPRWKSDRTLMNRDGNRYIKLAEIIGVGQNMYITSVYDEFAKLIYNVGDKDCTNVFKMIEFMENLVAIEEYN